MGFSNNEVLNDLLKRIGYVEKTPIQEKMLPCAFTKDVKGLSETGTGKTACFVVPIIEELCDDPYGVYALILAPTRELCIQIKEQVDLIGNYFGIKSCTIHGGIEIHRQSSVFLKRPHVVIATPGRLAALLKSNETAACFRRVKRVVLDEADILLNGSQASPVYEILKKMPSSFSLSMFSATDIVPRVFIAVDNIDTPSENHTENAQIEESSENVPNASYAEAPADSHKMLSCPEIWNWIEARDSTIIDVRKEAVPRQITQQYSKIHYEAKAAHLFTLLTEEYKDKRVIVFINRSEECAVLADVFQELGVNADSLSRCMDYKTRYISFMKFRQGETQVLFTTDIASRGIDIKNISLVINYDLPNNHIDYIHRIGRTGRYHSEGHALSFVSSSDVSLLSHIQKEIHATIAEKILPSFSSPKLLNRISTQRQFAMERIKKANSRN
ncbi:ATP-dependent RNA helicase DDX49/DBP8 [Nematocida sp. LUAm3]|nr:ATP-dependent RNA helicase DDX49/DBP8 [Nematocida sp. LUAm3]KAI5175402.1 ATP-dependent RNA helicase DDX49/DBP8 [Nematocida sp. LUAm2]KAI5177641.1 ATP-dependent RNA helicase DDX49/DBP8 [Nematocida sp. LUAm1]